MEEKLKKLEELVTKELEQITEKGLTSANLETTYKLIDILKDIKEVEEAGKETEGGGEDMKYFERGGRGGRGGYNGMYPMDYGEYGESGYNARGGGYNEGGYNAGGYNARGGYNAQGGGYNQGGGGYNAQGGGGGYNARGGRYQHYGPDIERFYEKLERMMECVEEYFMGKNRYHDGAHPGHMVEGLEKTMYAVCTLVESLMDTAETPEEKETIRKHIEKIKNL